MILHSLDRSSLHNSSFTAGVNEHPHFLKIWHHHIELELVFIVKSVGTCFLGDSIERFEEGDIYLVGENLPHMWLNDEAYFDDDSKMTAKAIAVHFKKDFLGKYFFETPEMIHLLELMERAKYGVRFRKVSNQLSQSIKDMLELDGFSKTMSFLKILDVLSKHKNYELLVSHGYVVESHIVKDKRLSKVYAHIFNNFNRKITLEEVAEIAHMHTSAFSRLFKQVNHKTFSKYLSELRIGYACKLLLEGKNNIAAICYESGFQNISNFNRQFKIIKNCTPSDYVNDYKNDLI
jgi:AraC-like DNA-binding protein